MASWNGFPTICTETGNPPGPNPEQTREFDPVAERPSGGLLKVCRRYNASTSFSTERVHNTSSPPTILTVFTLFIVFVST